MDRKTCCSELSVYCALVLFTCDLDSDGSELSLTEQSIAVLLVLKISQIW